MTESLIQFNSWFESHPYLLPAVLAWSIAWKAIATWKAARKNDKWWFIALFVMNTMGVLEIFYFFLISERESLKKNIS